MEAHLCSLVAYLLLVCATSVPPVAEPQYGCAGLGGVFAGPAAQCSSRAAYILSQMMDATRPRTRPQLVVHPSLRGMQLQEPR